MIKKIFRVLKQPSLILLKLDNINIIRLSDKKFLEYRFESEMGYKLNLKDPRTFNEKLQWLKLNNRNPLYTKLVDKYAVREYIKEKLGDEYLVPLIGVYDKFDEINFDELPNQFVMKCNHDSGGLIICKDKSKLDIKMARKKINKSLKTNYYYKGREWPYKNVKPKIVVEEYLENKKTKELEDYKFFCFNGKVRMILVCSKRFSSKNMCETFYDEDWNLFPVIENDHPIDKSIEKPYNYDKMVSFAEKLSKDIPFVRIDFYEFEKKIYFGEITFFPASGYEHFEPEEFNTKLGDLI